jgi:hypothetical protein
MGNFDSTRHKRKRNTPGTHHGMIISNRTAKGSQLDMEDGEKRAAYE